MYQSVEATAPDFDYIEKALACAYNSKSLRIESFNSETVSQPGENFCSVIYRLKVEYRKSLNSPLELGNYIVKDLIPSLAELGSSEIFMFEQLLPAMANILNRATNFEERKLSAKCLFAERRLGKELYLLEDLTTLGYVSFNRHSGLSLDHALLCLDKVAQFHATSMVLLQEDPRRVSQLPASHYAKGFNDPFAQAVVVDTTVFCTETIADWPGMSEIAQKMKAHLSEVYSERMRDVVDPKNCDFHVIVHGDLWLNNMMINTKKKETIIVDFQNCFIGSPAIDLHFIFHTSLPLDMLLLQQKKLLQYYYHRLCETLNACNYTKTLPSFAQLEKEMQRCLLYGYYAVVCELPICCASTEASEDFTVQTFTNTDAMLVKRRQLFANERVKQTLQATLAYFEEQGILNTS